MNCNEYIARFYSEEQYEAWRRLFVDELLNIAELKQRLGGAGNGESGGEVLL